MGGQEIKNRRNATLREGNETKKSHDGEGKDTANNLNKICKAL
jgi:hypothetical protein